METVLNILLIRFAVIAVVIVVVGLVAFAVVLRLKRRGRWDAARRGLTPYAARAARAYGEYSARRPRALLRGGPSLTARAADRLARTLRDDERPERDRT